MTIRPMTPDDYDQLMALWQSCEGMGLNDADDSREGIARFLSRNPETCFVAVEDRVVGAIMVGHDGRRGTIYHTAVHPEHRRAGIAARLVETALDALATQGIRKVNLVAFKDNQPGNAFWAGRGFGVRDDLVYRDRVLPVHDKASDDSSLIGYCGVDCAECPDRTGGKCPGCRESIWPGDDVCPPVACCREKAIPHCGACADFPCAMMAEFYEESDGHRAAYRRMCAARASH